MPFDHLTRFVIHNFRSLSRLCRGPHSPLGLDKLARSHELPAIYTNHEGANIVFTAPDSRRRLGLSPPGDEWSRDHPSGRFCSRPHITCRAVLEISADLRQ